MADERWQLWRQDDNGNHFLIEEFDTQAQAEKLRQQLESSAHKQMYWVSRKADRPGAPDAATVIYILVRGEDWRAAEAVGEYRGSADDTRDGFLHFSTASQVRASAARHRAGERDLLLVEVAVAALGTALRWEPARSSRPGLFPHLYGPLSLQAVRSVKPLRLTPDGVHAFPEGFA